MKAEENTFLGSNFLTFIGIFLFIALMFGANFYFGEFGSISSEVKDERFVVPTDYTSNEEIISKLNKEGFIKSEWAFNFALNWKGFQKNIEPGGYKLSKSMDAWKMSEIFMSGPYMKWVTIPEGLRKEEIADILAKELGWDNDKKNNWITKDTISPPEYFEGVYFPDTYLIPLAESGADVAKRLQNKFQEKFASYSKEALKQNIKWNTVIKLASIIQREAGSKDDMPLISGILWNRLDKKMPLQVDCTIQYARGDTGNGWWAPINAEDKKINSPYNTYIKKGLPPIPISNPGIEAIDAVINPTKTECLFYLHDEDGQIHCSKTYEEHKQNIEKYLL